MFRWELYSYSFFVFGDSRWEKPWGGKILRNHLDCGSLYHPYKNRQHTSKSHQCFVILLLKQVSLIHDSFLHIYSVGKLMTLQFFLSLLKSKFVKKSVSFDGMKQWLCDTTELYICIESSEILKHDTVTFPMQICQNHRDVKLIWLVQMAFCSESPEALPFAGNVSSSCSIAP